MLGCPRFGARCPQPYACHHNSDLSMWLLGEKNTSQIHRGFCLFFFFFFFGVCVWRWGNEKSASHKNSSSSDFFVAILGNEGKEPPCETRALQIMKPNRKQWVSTELEPMNVLAKGKDYRKDYFKKLKAAAFDVIFFFADLSFLCFCCLFCFCFQSKQMICKASRSSDGN